MISPERLSQIKARVEKASPGPWVEATTHEGPMGGRFRFRAELVDGPRPSDSEFPWSPIVRCCSSDEAWKLWDAGNRAFVAHARQDVPDLLQEVERLREALIDIEDNYRPHVLNAGRCKIPENCPACVARTALGLSKKARGESP